jgi:dienelactone hydrolase
MALDGFRETSFTHEGTTRVVYRRGQGPAVVVIHEIPGVTPAVIRFAERLSDAGFSVLMPSLFGVDGKADGPVYMLASITRACVSREFAVLAQRESSPITEWLRALARHAHAEIGGKGVGAIGMCLTGNFALSLAIDEAMLAPVLSQPSLPFALTPSCRRSLHVSDAELAHLRTRAKNGLKVLGLRFTGDPMCPGERFERLRQELGDGFEGIEIDSSASNAHGIGRGAHSVLTRDLVDVEGHPTRAALERVISFLRERLS